MRVTVLSSGSSGNSTLVESGPTRVLIDAGLTPRELSRRLVHARTRLEDVQAVFITHEHSDHGVGAKALASAGIAVYATAGTANALGLGQAKVVTAGVAVTLGELSVTPVALPHDAAEPVGYLLGEGEARAGVLTDCGHAAADVAAAFAGCDLLVLETNHDPVMLARGPYPVGLRQRIAGDNGHLSNQQAAALLMQMGAGRLPTTLVLAHLSLKNNRPELARAEIEGALARLGHSARVLIAAQKVVGPTLVVSRGQVELDVARTAQTGQLALPEPSYGPAPETRR